MFDEFRRYNPFEWTVDGLLARTSKAIHKIAGATALIGGLGIALSTGAAMAVGTQQFISVAEPPIILPIEVGQASKITGIPLAWASNTSDRFYSTNGPQPGEEGEPEIYPSTSGY